MNETDRVILFTAAGFLNGLVNTLASGGSAITLPLLVFMGLPANVANGTNRVQLLLGRLASLIVFQRAKVINWHYALVICLPVLAGNIVGAYGAAILEPKYIGWAIILAVILSLVLILTNPKRLLRTHPDLIPHLKWYHYVLFFLAGAWAGFIVLDSFTYYLLLLVLCVGFDLKGANGLKCVLSVVGASMALIIFTEEGEVNWDYGILMSIGSIAGSFIGGILATKEWIKVWIYRLLIIIITIEIYQLCMKYLRY